MPSHRTIHDRVRFCRPESEQDLRKLRQRRIGLRMANGVYVAAIAGLWAGMHLLNGRYLVSSAVHIDLDVSRDFQDAIQVSF